MLAYTAYEGLGLPLYITGLHSFEVLYLNAEGKKLFGDITGRKCYEALNGTAERCAGCISAARLAQGPCCAKGRFLVAAGKHVDTYESVVSLPDGAQGRLCLVVDITEQEQMRLESAAKEKARADMQYVINIQSGFIGSAKSMMTASSLAGDIIFGNQTMCDLLGYTQEELLHMRVPDFHPPDISRAFMEEYIPLALAEGSWRGDSMALKKDGSLLPVRQIVFPIRNEAGEIIAIASIMDDITKTLDFERMNRYQLAIMDSSANYIGVSDLDGNTMYHSPGAYRMLGYEPGEVEEWAMSNSHPAWYLERVVNEGIPTAMKEGQWVGRGEVIDRHGRHIPIEQTIFPVFDENRAPMGVATIIQDISVKVEQEKEIEAGRRMLRAIIDTAPSAIFWKDKNSRFLGANKQFASDTGVDDPDELIGKSDYDFYPREIADLYVAADRQAFETESELFHHEEPFQRADGVTYWVSTSKVLIRDETGAPYALLGISDDITKLKQNEAKLEEAMKAAEEASRAKSDFLSRMSHEIRTPMNAIIGMTKIGQAAGDIERMRYCFEKIDGASKHLLGLINDILDMSKIEANKLELVEEAFDFEKMLESICNVIGVRAEEKEQALLVDIHKNVPAEIIADEMRISQVITNLLSNAVKFTPEKGTIRLHVTCEGKADDGRLRLSVSISDTGIGLTDEQTAKLFRSFEQAEAGISRKYGGTGLGLAISKRIVELMDGEISVSSKAGAGSTFTFTILVRESLGPKRALPAHFAHGDIRVLVVDDAPEILDYFKRILDNFGIQCDTASHGEGAIGLVSKAIRENRPYNILFIDYLMEEMDGIETTRRVKELAGDSVSVIMVSQTEWTSIEADARRAGVAKYIAKPLFQSPILDCINQIVFRDEPPAASGQDGAAGIFRGARMLLAEDIEINREIVMALLEDTGVVIDCAVNGEEAVRMFANAENGYDVVMMDMQMPIMDGLEATRRIKALDTQAARDIPIIAMTANAFAEDVDACKKAGMVDHIGKPIDIDILLAKLQAHLPLGG